MRARRISGDGRREKMKQGMSRRDAVRAVRLERGGLELAKEVVRSGGWEFFVETCWQDLRYALRIFAQISRVHDRNCPHSRLGIGATTACSVSWTACCSGLCPIRNRGGLVEVGSTFLASTSSLAFVSGGLLYLSRAEPHFPGHRSLLYGFSVLRSTRPTSAASDDPNMCRLSA